MRMSDWSSDVCSSDLDPVVGHRSRDLVIAHRTLAIVVEPALGHHHEGAEHIEHLVVGDVVGAVHLVDPPDRGPRLRVVEPVPRRRLQQQRGVVVALLDVAGELTGLVEQPTDAGHRIGAEEGEAERLGRLEERLVGKGGVNAGNSRWESYTTKKKKK